MMPQCSDFQPALLILVLFILLISFQLKGYLTLKCLINVKFLQICSCVHLFCFYCCYYYFDQRETCNYILLNIGTNVIKYSYKAWSLCSHVGGDSNALSWNCVDWMTHVEFYTTPVKIFQCQYSLSSLHCIRKNTASYTYLGLVEVS